MSQESRSFLSFHPSDFVKAQKISKWISRWHGADYDRSEILHLANDWPEDFSLSTIMKPILKTTEEDSPKALANLVLELIRLLEQNRLDTAQAQGAFRMACMHLCERGIPFEETAKGNEAALRLHFLAVSEFGDPENVGYSTDLRELRLLAKYLLDPQELLEELLTGDLPRAYSEAYITVAGYLADKQLVPDLLGVLSRCEDPQSTATTIQALGRARDEHAVPALRGYAYSTNQEISTAAVLALEEIGGEEALEIIEEVETLMPEEDTFLSAHVHYAAMHLEEGENSFKEMLICNAIDPQYPIIYRLCALERLSGSCDEYVVKAVAGLLNEAGEGRLSLGTFLEDEILYSVRDAAYLALLDCKISDLVDVLGEDILDRLEVYQDLPF